MRVIVVIGYYMSPVFFSFYRLYMVFVLTRQAATFKHDESYIHIYSVIDSSENHFDGGV